MMFYLIYAMILKEYDSNFTTDQNLQLTKSSLIIKLLISVIFQV